LPRPGDELARRDKPALCRGELGGVRPVGGQRENWSDLDGDTTPAKDAGCMPRQPLDVLAAATPGDRGGRRDRNEPQGPVAQPADRGHQRGGQWPHQVAATPLLVRQQAGPHDPGVDRGHRHRRQTRRGRVRAMPARSGERLPAPPADGPAGGGATDAPAREGQIGQDGEHATTVPPSAGSR
jgi:hypothetical protein